MLELAEIELYGVMIPESIIRAMTGLTRLKIVHRIYDNEEISKIVTEERNDNLNKTHIFKKHFQF